MTFTSQADTALASLDAVLAALSQPLLSIEQSRGDVWKMRPAEDCFGSVGEVADEDDEFDERARRNVEAINGKDEQ